MEPVLQSSLPTAINGAKWCLNKDVNGHFYVLERNDNCSPCCTPWNTT